jgi:hypothetical protein
MKFQTKKSFSEVCTFNCRLTKFFGYIFIKSSPEKPENQQEISIQFLLYTIFGIFASVKSSDLNTGNGSESIIVTIGLYIMLQMTLFMPTIFRVLNFSIRRLHQEIIDKIQSIDDDLHNMGIDTNYQRQFQVAITITSLYFGLLFVTFYVDNDLGSRYLEFKSMDPVSAVLSAFSVCGYLSYQICHMLLALAIYQRIRSMNEVIQTGIFSELLVQKLSRIHTKLSNTLSVINSCFSVNLLNFFFQFTIFSIFFFFKFFLFLV